MSRGSSTSVAVYRHNASINTLTLLFIGGETLLPDPSGSNTLTANVNLEDLFADETGTVYFRGRVGSTHTGFWKIDPSGTISLIKSLSQFPAVPTDRGNITFRSVEAGDWGVAPDGTIYFSSDANLGSATRVEGIWKIDGTTFDVTTIARETDPAIPPTTAITFSGFSKLSASGDGVKSQAVFMATLSDGTEALYATDPSGSFVKITREGEALDGSTVTALHYTPDAAGAGLAINQGAPGVNRFGAIAFVADLANNTTALVRAEFERELVPTGNIYVWDGGAGDTNWHTATGGRSNWVDSNGIPWDAPPKSDGTSVIKIGVNKLVQILADGVSVDRIELTGSSLEANENMNIGTFTGDADSSLVLMNTYVAVGNFSSSGAVFKESANDLILDTFNFSMVSGTVEVTEGEMDLLSSNGLLDNTPVVAMGGSVSLGGTFRFTGANARVESGSSGSEVVFGGGNYHFESDFTLETTHPGALINLGFNGGGNVFIPHFDGGTTSDPRELIVSGPGSCDVFSPFTIPANGVVRVNEGASVEGANLGLLVRLPAGQVISSIGLLENNAITSILSGGIAGNFTNKKKLKIVGLASPLNCDQQGDLEQNENAEYANFTARSGSNHFPNGYTFKPADPATGSLVYEGGSKIESLNNGEIVFPDSGNPGLDADVIVRSGTLTIRKAVTPEYPLDGKTELKIIANSGGEIVLDDFTFSHTVVSGEGKATLTGTQYAFLFGDIGIFTNEFEIFNAILLAEFNREKTFGFYPNAGGNQTGVMRNVDARGSGNMYFKKGTVVTVEENILVASTIKLYGELVVKADISPPDIGFFAAIIAYAGSKVTVPENLGDPVVISYPISINGTDTLFRIGENSQLVIPPSGSKFLFQDNSLIDGKWEIANGASCDIKDNNSSSQVSEIGLNAVVKLVGSSPASKLGNLPNVNTDLSVLGELTLEGTELNMGGNTLRTTGKVFGKVVGDVRSIRDEVQGSILLSGNLNIDGSLTTDGTLSLGASPGTGLITGDLNLLPGSEMIVEFAGTTPGTEFDFLEVGGTANLDGSLTLKLLDDYRPALGTSFQFLQAGTVSGDFTTIDQSCLPRDLRFTVAPAATGLSATIGTLSIANYAQWRAAYFYGADLADDLVSGPAADPDGDGQSNLLEYVTDGRPCEPDLPPLTIVSAKPSILELRWANGVTDYTWQLQSSLDLESPWSIAAHTIVSQTMSDTRSDFELVPDAAFNTANNRYFRIDIVPVAP